MPKKDGKGPKGQGPRDGRGGGGGTIVIRATKAQDDLFYATSTIATVEAIRGAAILTLRDLTQTYDGTPKHATVTTDPQGMEVEVAFTYDGSATAPTEVGSYTVVASVDIENWIGSTTGTLTIQLPPSVVHQIQLGVDGSVALMFATVPGLKYRVQYCDSLADEWQDVGPSITATAAVTSWTDSGPPATLAHPQDVTSRFYRVVIVQRM